jgi:hypothetical protein
MFPRAPAKVRKKFGEYQVARMFAVSNQIPNDGPPCFVTEVCFNPDGKIFAATYEQKNEVRIFDAQTSSLLRVFANPAADLDKPHAVLLTEKHLIVASKGAYPSPFRIFRLDDDSGTPVHTYTTPYKHLAEAHSMARSGRRLVVTYCEGEEKQGSVVCYDFDEESGQILRALDISERWFRRYGDVKGVCFDETGEKVYLTYQSDIWNFRPENSRERRKNALSLGLTGLTSRNGVAVFGIDKKGRFTRRPLWNKVFDEFCRLENIHICGHQAVVTDAVTGRVLVYDLRRERPFEAAAQVIADPLVFPHGVKFSPDGTQMVVTDNGLEVVNNDVRWNSWVSPRSDRLVVFKRQAA